MREYLIDLYEIQKIDLNIREQQKQVAGAPSRLQALEGTRDRLRLEIGAVTDRREQAIQEAQTLRHVVESETQKIRKWESRSG